MKIVVENEWLEFLNLHGGYYKCPYKDGKRAGLLVGYTGRYDAEHHQYVGEIYADFSKIERRTPSLQKVARAICALENFSCHTQVTGFCGVTEGGRSLGLAIAMLGGKNYIFPEKKVTVAETRTSREIADMEFKRHEPVRGERWWIVEDVCNNFSTTQKLIELFATRKATVVGIVCFLNRSLNVEDTYTVRPGFELPVVALVRHKIMEYRQDDPFVAEDVKNKRVIWHPRMNWSPLANLMALQ